MGLGLWVRVRVRIRVMELGLGVRVRVGVRVTNFGVPQSYTDRTEAIFLLFGLEFSFSVFICINPTH